MKYPLTAGIEPATFRIVAQHLNHCTTAVPTGWAVRTFKIRNWVTLWTVQSVASWWWLSSDMQLLPELNTNFEQSASYSLILRDAWHIYTDVSLDVYQSTRHAIWVSLNKGARSQNLQLRTSQILITLLTCKALSQFVTPFVWAQTVRK